MQQHYEMDESDGFSFAPNDSLNYTPTESNQHFINGLMDDNTDLINFSTPNNIVSAFGTVSDAVTAPYFPVYASGDPPGDVVANHPITPHLSPILPSPMPLLLAPLHRHLSC